jgi:AcrR family transcriptional regulator
VSTVRRTRRSSEEIRSLIMNAARKVFAERGYAGSTTRMISEEAGVSESLLFKNFENKSKIFSQSVIEPLNERFSNFLRSTEEDLGNIADRSADFVHMMYPFLRDNSELLHALVKSGTDVSSDVLEEIDIYFDNAAARIRLRSTRNGTRFDTAPELMVRYVFGMIAGTILLDGWLFPGAKGKIPDEDALSRLVYRIVEPKP